MRWWLSVDAGRGETRDILPHQPGCFRRHEAVGARKSQEFYAASTSRSCVYVYAYKLIIERVEAAYLKHACISARSAMQRKCTYVGISFKLDLGKELPSFFPGRCPEDGVWALTMYNEDGLVKGFANMSFSIFRFPRPASRCRGIAPGKFAASPCLYTPLLTANPAQQKGGAKRKALFSREGPSYARARYTTVKGTRVQEIGEDRGGTRPSQPCVV